MGYHAGQQDCGAGVNRGSSWQHQLLEDLPSAAEQLVRRWDRLLRKNCCQVCPSGIVVTMVVMPVKGYIFISLSVPDSGLGSD